MYPITRLTKSNNSHFNSQGKKPVDCLVIGFNDSDFADYADMVRSMGPDSGAYRDLALAFIEYQGKPYRSLDILNHFYFQGRGQSQSTFGNVNFLWPVVTYLGTYLSRRGFSFDYVNLFHLEKEKLREKLTQTEVLTVAITTTLYVSPQPILEIISFIREHSQTAKIIVGGPYIANQAKMLDRAALQGQLKYLGADFYVISQEGEQALVNLLGALKQNAGLDNVDNLAYRSGTSYVLTRDSIESNRLEENLVDYTLFPQAEIDQFVSTRTAKSCPFACSFCGFPQRAGKYKYTGVELVEKELNAIRDIGTVTTLTFLDDTFNVPKTRFREILEMMIRNQYPFTWNCFYRSDHGDAQTIELMKQAGCEGVFLGIESGSDAMLQTMNKTARRADYQAAIPRLNEAGISTYASLIVGFPGETFATVQETISLIEEAQPEFFRAQLWYCDPTTPIWERRAEFGINGAAFTWSHNTMDSNTACDLIDELFLSIENSTWLPQYGFEQWSTFYLQRKGMSRKQLRQFLKCFNAVKKEQLLFPNQKSISPDLLRSLEASCQFDRNQEPDMQPVEILSGANYMAAERFWVQEFADVEAETVVLTSARETNGGWMSQSVRLERPVLDGLLMNRQADLSILMLAAYSILLSRINGREETTIVWLGDQAEATAIPLRLFPSWGLSFTEFVGDLQRKLAQVINHGRYAFPILTSPLRLAEPEGSIPAFKVGYLYCDLGPSSGSGWQASHPDALLEAYAEAAQAMNVILSTIKQGDHLTLQLLSREGALEDEAVELLTAYLAAILEAVGKDHDLLLGEIAFTGQSEAPPFIEEADAREAFNF